MVFNYVLNVTCYSKERESDVLRNVVPVHKLYRVLSHNARIFTIHHHDTEVEHKYERVNMSPFPPGTLRYETGVIQN